MDPPHLFVYGTLLSCFRDDLLNKARARLVGTGEIRARLYDLGPYPGAKASLDPTERVRGEVHRLFDLKTALSTLDEYEGFVPDGAARSPFVRAVVSVILDDGIHLRAWTYFYNRPVDDSRLLPGGDWARSGRIMRTRG
jgi:gamma-glutamylcyclotransferase (GGCT)/AIG2-like uncharacterized protein YtfP